jgi:hypothetical protein
MNAAHQSLLNRCLLAVSTFGRAWANDTPGLAYTRDGTPFKSGLKGSSDILGLLRPNGQMIAVEVKTGKGHLTKEQRAFGKMVEAMGGIFICARSVEDVANRLMQEGYKA